MMTPQRLLNPASAGLMALAYRFNKTNAQVLITPPQR